MIKLTAIGNLGRDAEVKETGAGDYVITFSIAVNRRTKQQEKTTWIACAKYVEAGKDGVAAYLKKGTQVYVEGTPDSKGWLDKKTGEYETGIHLTVTTLTLLGRPERNEEPVEKAPF